MLHIMDMAGGGVAQGTHKSSGYTSVFAMTAPAAPATALPHGGNTSTFDCPAIVEEVFRRVSELL